MANPDTIAPAIVFDFGGVLMDWSPHYLYRRILGDDRQAIDRFLKEVDFFTWNIEQDRGRTFAEGTAELIGKFPQHADLIRAYDERYIETVGGAFLPVVEILRGLKDAGYALYGLSNWPAEKFRLVRPGYPFFEWFNDIVVSGEEKLVKPDRAIYEVLLRRVGRPASECIFIDDAEHNIAAARDMGFQTIHFRSAEQLKEELSRRGIQFEI
ncbi:MAG TPA: HAD family phosphatase [Anaerolineaceae bacterium]